MNGLWVIALGVFGATACASSVVPSEQPPLRAGHDARIERVADSLIPALLRGRRIPGAAVAVLARDTVLFVKGYGVADVDTRRPVGTSTIFQLASTTKPMTAIVIMRLVEAGKIGLDAPVKQYVTWLPQQYTGITIRQLLTHTSGVRYDLRRENVDEFSLEEFRRRLEASEAAFPPGTRWQYSNTGYTLLALAAEHVSGKSFAVLLREFIFQPLGMTGAGYRVSTPGPEHAVGYDLVDGTLRRAPQVFSGWGNSGVEANILDVARWVASLSRRSLLRPESYALVEAVPHLKDGSPVEFQFSGGKSSYGFGWFLTTYRGKRLVTHGGAIAGFSSIVNRFDDIAIIVMSNGKQGADRRGQADAIATALFDRLTFDATQECPTIP
jgi:CubicO group peptidase (beta-lactamase class C family)